MVEQKKTMTTSEWQVMRVIWTLGEATSRQLITILSRQNDWSPSTIKTLITRLHTKGFLIDNGASRDRLYLPLISERDAMTEALEQTIQSMCPMCVGSTLSQVLKHTPLSQQDIQQLESVLANRKETAPQHVACNCILTTMGE